MATGHVTVEGGGVRIHYLSKGVSPVNYVVQTGRAAETANLMQRNMSLNNRQILRSLGLLECGKNLCTERGNLSKILPKTSIIVLTNIDEVNKGKDKTISHKEIFSCQRIEITVDSSGF